MSLKRASMSKEKTSGNYDVAGISRYTYRGLLDCLAYLFNREGKHKLFGALTLVHFKGSYEAMWGNYYNAQNILSGHFYDGPF